MMSLFAKKIKAEKELDEDELKKRKAELHGALKEAADNYRFPEAVPEVGQRVRVAYKRGDRVIILEGIVMCRSSYNTPRRVMVQISRLEYTESRIGTQDLMSVIYDGENSTWHTDYGDRRSLAVLAALD